MSLLNKVKEYVSIELSEDYQKAKRMVQDHQLLLDNIKKNLKDEGKTKVVYRTDNGIQGLSFDVSKNKRVDIKALPRDIREQYLVDMEVWKVKIIDVDNDEL